MNGGIIGSRCTGRGVYTIGDHYLNVGRSRIPERAITFDGTDDYVSVGCVSFGAGLATGTFEAWIKTTSTAIASLLGSVNDGYTTLLDFSLNRDYNASLSVGKLHVQVRDDSAKNLQCHTTSAYNFYDGLWHHVSATWAGASNAIKIYLDGVLLPVTYKQQTTPVSFSNFQYPCTFGANNGRGTIGGFFNGTIDELRFWTDVRTQAEIREYMRKRVDGSEAGLYGAWHLNEGQGTALADVMGNNNGTLNGGTWIDAADVAWWDEVSA